MEKQDLKVIRNDKSMGKVVRMDKVDGNLVRESSPVNSSVSELSNNENRAIHSGGHSGDDLVPNEIVANENRNALRQDSDKETLVRHDNNEEELWKWETRDSVNSSVTRFKANSSHLHSLLDDSVGQDLSDKLSSQQSLQKDLSNLKIKSKRGRPRKISKEKENKFFKVPLKRKFWKKYDNPQMKLIEPETKDVEASLILESGLLMGLISNHDREQSLQLIKDNLAV